VSIVGPEHLQQPHARPASEQELTAVQTPTALHTPTATAPLGFDFFLIAMCTLYAFKTRNVPENFNEAKFIGFTMYTTLVIWIAFVVIYLSSEHKVTTLCLCISFSALFALFLLFFPRCYIIIFKPEKNNRSYFKTTKNVRCHIGYQMGSGSGQANASAAHASPAGVAAGANCATVSNTSEQQRRFLSSLCKVAAASQEGRTNGQPDQEHFFDELSSQLADELASALVLDGEHQPPPTAMTHELSAEQQQQRTQAKGFR
jgi:hypothetical protein